MGSIELAKEVSGPLASMLAFGGLTAWWLLSSNKDEPQNDIGHQVAKHVLTGLTIIDNIQVQVSNLLNGSDDLKDSAGNDPKNDSDVPGTESQSNQDLFSSTDYTRASQYSFASFDDTTTYSEGTETENSTSQSSLSEEALAEAVKNCEASVSDEGCPKFCIAAPEHREQLIKATMLGDEDFVSSALCDIDAGSLDDYDMDEYGNSLLILAVQGAQASIVDLLLRRGVDVDAQNFRGHTALHFACAFSHQRLADALRAAGARTDIQNFYGLTPEQGLGGQWGRLRGAEGGGAVAPRPAAAAVAGRGLRRPILGSSSDLDAAPALVATGRAGMRRAILGSVSDFGEEPPLPRD